MWLPARVLLKHKSKQSFHCGAKKKNSPSKFGLDLRADKKPNVTKDKQKLRDFLELIKNWVIEQTLFSLD